MERILFVTNLDNGVSQAIVKLIVNYGYDVVVKRTLANSAEVPAGEDVGLVIVCQQKPLDYLETCRLIRGSSFVPVLVLRDRSDTLEMVAALEMGADDFVALPTHGGDGLLARIRALIRRDHLLRQEHLWSRIIG